MSYPDFEQFIQYGPIPDTGQELNLRAVYDRTAKAIRNYSAREQAADELAHMVKKHCQDLGIKHTSKEYNQYASTLKDEGLVQIPNVLTNEQIDAIHSYIEDKTIIDFYNPSKQCTLNNIPPDTNIGRYETEININCPYIFEALNHPLVLQTVEEYLKAPATLSVIMLMWSFNNTKDAQQMQLYHRDNDDYRFCKLFVYLSDVDDDNDGPHIFVKKSNSHTDVKNALNDSSIPAEDHSKVLRTLFGGYPHHRYDQSLVEKTFDKDNISKLLGKKGASFIENTWGIHRGLPPKRKPRLLLQAQYSLQPSPMFTYTPRKLTDMSSYANNISLEKKHIDYVNRLYVKPNE